MAAATQTLLDDRYVHIDAWLPDEVGSSFCAVFMMNDGTNKPKGFLGDDVIAQGSHDWDKVEFTLSGAAGAFSGSNPAILLGYPTTEVEDMPDIGASAFATAFGDFLLGFLIVDRHGPRALRDPHSLKTYVLF